MSLEQFKLGDVVVSRRNINRNGTCISIATTGVVFKEAQTNSFRNGEFHSFYGPQVRWINSSFTISDIEDGDVYLLEKP
jgi:hypothetical protein